MYIKIGYVHIFGIDSSVIFGNFFYQSYFLYHVVKPLICRFHSFIITRKSIKTD